MAVLLVGLSVMAIMMAAAMPVWKHAAQREKEEELIFRGKQYARAVELYGRKIANALPPNLDVLLNQKFLRKKYKDPITGEDFNLVSPNTPAAPPSGQQGAGGRGAQPAPARGAAAPNTRVSVFSTPGGTIGLQAGIIGVVSKSKESSIRIYNGRTHYNEWVFQYVQRQQAPGAGGVPGQRGAPGQQPPGGIPGIPGRGPGGRGDGRGGPPNGPPGGRGFGGPTGQPFPPIGQPPPPQRPPGN